MKNIHVLPTNKPSRVFITKDEGLGFDNQMLENTELDCQNQNLYITSDVEIKEGDWFIRDGSIHKCFRVHKTDIEFLTSIDSIYCGSNTFWSKEFCQKIILTTDQDLIKDGVQAIDDEFLQWYVKNPSCEYVKTDLVPVNEFGSEITVNSYGFDKFKYKIIIPKEEPKQTVEQYEQQGLEKYAYEFQQETPEEAGKRVSELVDAMDSNMEMFSITNQIDELGYAVSNMRDIIHEIVKILDVK
jgi:hypothetical protein